jgi:serine protease Do
MSRTHYEVLGVERHASSVEIAAGFRERVDEFKNRTYAGTDSIEDVREAYRVLSNAVARSGYDETLPAYRRQAAKSGGIPGWMKWALPVVIVVAGFAWMKWSKPREPVMTVKSVSRVANDYDPTRPAPVTIAPPVPGNAFESTASNPLLPAVAGTAESVFASASQSVARVLVRDAGGQPVSQGSGVVIGSGTVVTNCHVTRNGSEISVKVGNEEYRASLAAEDNEHDLCKLSVPGLSAPAVALASVATLKTGQRVFAIGAPHGLELTISEGIVSALRDFPDGKVIQTSAPISPGSSGGGLFDTQGRLVGIVTFQHKFGQNLNFAVPADWINKL